MEIGVRTVRTVDTNCIHIGDKDPIFEVYESEDLNRWTGPYVAFQPPKGCWGVRHYWAPEVYEVDGRYYMFASFKGEIGANRGTAILIADHPAGPYQPHSDGPVTLKESECLDGTYFEDSADGLTGHGRMTSNYSWTGTRGIRACS